jgi:hypothetical protein
MAVINPVSANKLKVSTTASGTSMANLSALKKDQASQAAIARAAAAQASMMNRMTASGF